jgi:hypothetical protein
MSFAYFTFVLIRFDYGLRSGFVCCICFVAARRRSVASMVASREVGKWEAC